MGSGFVVGATGCRVVGLSASRCVMLMRISESGCRALSEIEFKSNSVRRQVGYLTPALFLIDNVMPSGEPRQSLSPL